MTKNNPRELIYEEEEEDSIQEKIDTGEYEPQEEVPEAFIPDFNIAPDDIPPDMQVPSSVPTQEEQQSTLQQLYAKLGLNKAKEFIEQPTLPMTPDKELFVQDSSQLVANLLSSVSTWIFVLVAGIEYQSLAPTPKEAEDMARPVMNIVARHSRTVAKVSPDWVDISHFGKAFSDYSANMWEALREIQRQKREGGAGNNGRYTTNTRTGQNGTSSTTTGPDDTRGYATAPDNQEYSPNDGIESIPTGDLDEHQRFNFEQLRNLSKKDYEHRARRAGRL